MEQGAGLRAGAGVFTEAGNSWRSLPLTFAILPEMANNARFVNDPSPEPARPPPRMNS